MGFTGKRATVSDICEKIYKFDVECRQSLLTSPQHTRKMIIYLSSANLHKSTKFILRKTWWRQYLSDVLRSCKLENSQFYCLEAVSSISWNGQYCACNGKMLPKEFGCVFACRNAGNAATLATNTLHSTPLAANLCVQPFHTFSTIVGIVGSNVV